MKRFIALILAATLAFTTAGCTGKPSAPQDLVSTEDTILSREEDEEMISEDEFPDANNISAIEEPSESSSASSSSSVPSSSASSSVSSAAPQKSSSSSTASSSQSSKSSSSSSSSSSQSSSESSEEYEDEDDDEPKSVSSVSGEVRAVWISYLDLSPMIKGKTRSTFRSNIGAAFDNVADLGLNTVIVQVRPFGDALYRSSYFPWSYLISNSNIEGKDPGYDPLEIMVSEAHSRGLKFEAWLNPYRIRSKGSKVDLASNNIASEWLEDESDYVIEYGGGIYYNPARKEVQDLIVNGVKEIVADYDVDGIHFDDYFYPAPDKSFDEDAYAEYKSGGGNLSLASWRRSNVDTLVKRVYSTIKSTNKSCKFGISPQGNRSNNYNLQYIDVEKWTSNAGYIDYICPQIYWGYNNSSAPYQDVLEDWESLINTSRVKLYVGLAAYKIGGSEKDFINSTNIMKRQVLSAREQDHYKGFALYRYDSLFNPDSSLKSQINREVNNLKSILD